MWSASTVYFSGGFAGGEGAPGVDNVSTADGASSGGLDGESGLVRAVDGSTGRSSSPSPFSCRVPAIAEEPEPVQLTWLGWCAKLLLNLFKPNLLVLVARPQWPGPKIIFMFIL